jgi:hypothetical protein
VLLRELVAPRDEACGAEERVAARVERRRARVRGAPRDAHVVPPVALRAGDDADLRAARLEDRALFYIESGWA